jgi:hypothetical protein
MTKQTTEFKLIGLSAGNRCTIQVDFDSDKDWFHSHTNFTKDRFKALFDYFKKGPDDAWKGKNIAVVEHDGLSESGIPKNPTVIEVKL